MSFDLLASRDVYRYIDQDGYVVIDLRSYEEYEQGHIKGAQNLPFEYLDDYVGKLPSDKTYILYCNYGASSMRAGIKMQAYGLNVLSISGGINVYEGKKYR